MSNIIQQANMKVILSRKGFDSANGGIPSPILPDGTLLSLPIPSELDREIKFSDIYYGEKSYYDIIKELKPQSHINGSSYCHLDPDLRKDIKIRPVSWIPAYGQTGAALSELYNNKIGIGDLFLFFGWFKQTELSNGKLQFRKGTPNLHIIYGYLQVGSIISSLDNIPVGLEQHPHAKQERWNKNNAIFLPTNHLSILKNLPGASHLKYSNKLVLTKNNCSRSRWSLPDFFRDIYITHHNSKSWKEDYFQSAAIGQEFIFETNNLVVNWIKSILNQ